jgi:hypothetical protein
MFKMAEKQVGMVEKEKLGVVRLMKEKEKGHEQEI